MITEKVQEKITNEVLCQQIQQGNVLAKEQIFRQNEGMIHVIAWRERKRYAYLSVELEDLWSAGQMGLLRAAMLFRTECGNQFATYAWMHIRQAVQREIINGGTMIRIPVHLHDRMHKISIYREPFSQTDYHELAKRMESEEYGDQTLTEKEVRDYLCRIEPLCSLRSLNETVKQDGGAERQELIADPNIQTPEKAVSQRILVEACLAHLTQRERDVIVLRYGLKGCSEHTLLEVGKKLQITKERVRQLEQQAVEKMHSWCSRCDFIADA